MGDRGEDMQQRTTGRNRSQVAAIRTEPSWCALYPVSHRVAPNVRDRNVVWQR